MRSCTRIRPDRRASAGIGGTFGRSGLRFLINCAGGWLSCLAERSSGRQSCLADRTGARQWAAICFALGTLYGMPLTARELAWQLEPGREYRLQVERVVRQNSPLATWSETIRYAVVWQVVSRDPADGKMQLVQRLVEVRHAMQVQDGEPVEYDSTQATEPRGDAAVLARHWKPLLRVERPLLLLPSGRLEVPAVPPATASAPAPPANPTPVPTVRQPAAKVLPEGLWTLPTGDVTLGTRWAEVAHVAWGNEGETLRMTTTFVYAGEQTIEQQIFDRLDVTVDVEVQARTDGKERLTIERQRGAGTIDFDAVAGHLLRSELVQEMTVLLQPATSAGAGTATTTSVTPPVPSSTPVPAAVPTASPVVPTVVRAEISTSMTVQCQLLESAPEVTTPVPRSAESSDP